MASASPWKSASGDRARLEQGRASSSATGAMVSFGVRRNAASGPLSKQGMQREEFRGTRKTVEHLLARCSAVQYGGPGRQSARIGGATEHLAVQKVHETGVAQ